MLGKLTLDAFKHDMVVMGGVATMLLGLLSIVILLTYLKRWRWLWKEWITTVDPKKLV